GERYGVDRAQAARVETAALKLFDQVADAWSLDADDRRELAWAARVHELGLALAHSQYHQHGAYVIEYSDIAGFSKTEQQFLAALVRNQRRSLNVASFEALPDRLAKAALRCALLLRLAVLLHRSHDKEPIPVSVLRVDGNELNLRLSKRWLEAHPLTRADLDTETDYLRDIDYALSVKTG